MTGFLWFALALGLLAALRDLVTLLLLRRYLTRARVRSIPKGPTPPLRLHLQAPTDEVSDADFEASLRQNYPDFEVHVASRSAAERQRAEAIVAGVPDVKVEYEHEPGDAARSPRLIVACRNIRPDPLFLRDAANGLAVAPVVGFLEVHFGADRKRLDLDRLEATLEGTFRTLLTHGGTGGSSAHALDLSSAEPPDPNPAFPIRPLSATLARRAVRCTRVERRISERARLHRVGRPVQYGFGLLASFAPLVLLTGAFCGGAAWALPLLGASLGVRILIGIALDFRFCWDRSLMRALPLLPLTWIWTPLGYLGGLLPFRRA